MLYGADNVETCTIEIALPWKLHPDASYVQRVEAPERDADSELQHAKLADAERDREIASRPAHMPTDLYDKAKVYVDLAEPIVVLDLDDVGARRDLMRIPEIAERMHGDGLPDLDRSVLTGRYVELNRAIAAFDLRGQLTSTRLDPGDVARILRRRATAAGINGDFARHSLRRGFITNAAKKKIPIASIKRVTGQRSNAIVLDYVAAATLDNDPPLLEIVRT